MKPLLFSAALISTLSAPVLAEPPASQDDTIQSLQTMVHDLQREVDALKAQNTDQWLTEQRAEEIRGLVQDVMADADTRASLLGSALSAGYDKGFVISSDDGNFKLKMNGQIQVRFDWNNQSDFPPDGDSNRSGFENRRTKLKFKGHVVDPSWQFAINGAFSSAGGAFDLEDAFIRKILDDGWSIRAGQFKPALLREELTSSSRQLAVERSLVNEEFNQDRSQGVEAEYRNDDFRVRVMFSDGIGQGSLGFPGSFGGGNAKAITKDTEYAFTGRIDWLVEGDWKQFKDFTSPQGSEFAVMLGAAAHTQKGEFGDPVGGGVEETELTTITVDASVECNGGNFFAAAIFRSAEAIGATDVDQSAFVAQGGYYFNKDWEGFVRYEFGDYDTVGIEDLSLLTVGVNRYYSSHSLKWTTDLTFGLNEIASPWVSSSAGFRTDAVNDDGQIVFRTQFQLLF